MINNITKEYLPSIIETTMHGNGDSSRHLLPLFSIALASKGKLFLELGVQSGATTLPLLLAAHTNGGKLISVDINPTEFMCPPELAMYGGYEPHYHTNPAMWKGELAYGGPFRAINELKNGSMLHFLGTVDLQF